jgi:ABC-type spermidine/putrescine transport system, permease component I
LGKFLVHIYAWLFLLERDGLINKLLLSVGLISEPLFLSYSFGAMYVVMVYCYLPFMIMPLFSALEKIDKRLLEASADLGATPWQTFWRVTMPLSMPGIRTGLSLVLVPSFGEFIIPSLLGGSKYMLVGSLISYYFVIARNNGYGAAFTYVSALSLIGSVGLFFVLRFIYRVMKGRQA